MASIGHVMRKGRPPGLTCEWDPTEPSKIKDLSSTKFLGELIDDVTVAMVDLVGTDRVCAQHVGWVGVEGSESLLHLGERLLGSDGGGKVLPGERHDIVGAVDNVCDASR